MRVVRAVLLVAMWALAIAGAWPRLMRTPVEEELALALREQAQLQEEQRRLRAELLAAEDELARMCVEEITAARLSAGQMSIYLCNDDAHNPTIQAHGRSR